MSESQPESYREKLWTRSFITITVSSLLLFMSLQMLLSPFPSYVKEQFHPGDFALSLVTGIFALAAIAARVAAAKLMRSVSRSALLWTGVTIAAAATALYSFAGSVPQVLLLRVLFGIGFGIASTVLPTLVSELIPRSRLGEGIGYFGLSTSLAMSFGPMIGLSVLQRYGFPPLTALGTLTLALIIPLLLLTRSVPSAPANQAGRARPGQSAGAKRRPLNARIYLPASLNILMAVTYGGLLSFLALFGQEAGLEQVGLFFLFNAITVLIIRPISGRLFDSKGPGAVLVPAAILMIASLLLLSYTHSLPMLIVSAMLYGLAFGGIQPTAQAWMLKESPPEQHSAANGLFYNSTDIGVAFGSMLLGVIASQTSYAAMYRYASLAMALFLVIYLASSLLQPKRFDSPGPKRQPERAAAAKR